MKFDIYIPTSPDDNTATYYTSIEADSQQEAEEKAADMLKKGEMPKYYSDIIEHIP